MWSTVGAIGVMVLLAVMIFAGCASVVRSMTRGRYTMQGDDVEEMMFRKQHDRRLNRQAGMAVEPHWWQRKHRR